MQADTKYQSLLDTLTTYEFISLQDLLSEPKTALPKFVRVIGKLLETKDGTTLNLEGQSMQCNMAQMRHTANFNSTNYYECFAELVCALSNKNRMAGFYIFTLSKKQSESTCKCTNQWHN